MSDYAVALASIGATLTAVGVAAGVQWAREQARKLAELERRVNELQPAARHDGMRRIQQDAAEAILFDAAHLVEDLNYAQARMDYMLRHIMHIRNGGSPDDKPSAWPPK